MINHNRNGYVKSWKEFIFLPNALTALENLARSQFVIIVVTNQSPIGRGIISRETLEGMHNKMRGKIARRGGRIDDVYYCPHVPALGCDCRKPQPGMFFEAAEKHGIDLSRSYFVGDAKSDMQAALNAGCDPVFVLTGRGKKQAKINAIRRLGRSDRV